ncbi:MAG: DNA glycosylase [Clostridia bacterium]|nr:DNA glycosylase [Clostridia bacterium]
MIRLPNKDFSLKDTFECGQCFRWEERATGYVGVAFNAAAHIFEDNGQIFLEGTREDFWENYFDLDRDYGKIKNAVSTNDVMRAAVRYGGGIRILRQDFFETLISFIISQRSSIPKIKSTVRKMCERWGDKIEFYGDTYFAFPAPEALAGASESELRSLGMGYRAPYVLSAARAFCAGFFCDIYSLPTPLARQKLLSLYGVGDKVCDCVLLFSLARYDIFPSDVWIKRVMEEEFSAPDAKSAGENLFGEYSGFAQQYLFYWRKFSSNVAIGSASKKPTIKR